MVVKMMRWRPWPPLAARKYEVKLILKRLEGLDLVREGAASQSGGAADKLAVEIRWKGQKLALSSLRRATVKRNFTKEVEVVVDDEHKNGVVFLEDEEFRSVCTLSSYKENVFHPWEISFSIFNGFNQGMKKQALVIGTASLNLAEFASATEQEGFELSIPLTLSAGTSVAADLLPSLCMSLSLLELRTAQESTETVPRTLVPESSPPQAAENVSNEKDELSAIKAGLRKVKIFTEYVSTRRTKKPCREEDGSEGRCSARSDD
ncbi:uncharacterized protein, partial [Rutidosis leptorrhynchoides]|uniref:uncharacterized protein n=1 Tax=Rutidosis leptorrhynchoides TaxID=125765 RepID=UPI003A9A3A59